MNPQDAHQIANEEILKLLKNYPQKKMEEKE